ncbi:MAG: penicillin-binding protein 2 [Candidatus Paceibacterota bacterium]
MSPNSKRIRIRIISGLAVLLSLFLLTRLYFVQIVDGDDYRDEAMQQYTQSSNQIFNRGSIYLTAKDGTRRVAALQESGFTLAVNAQFIDNPEAVYQSLAEVIALEKEDFLQAVADRDDPYVVLQRRLDPETAAGITTLNIKGVGVYPEKWRRYPHGLSAAHVLGYVGYSSEGDERVGIYGIERIFDDVLSRSGGLYVNFFAQVFAGIGDVLSSDPASREGDIILTLEPDVQSYLEKLIADVGESWGTEQVMGIVIDPNTGAIKAMAATPSYDPNDYGSVTDPAVFTNPLVQSRFEMGSIIKALTVAAGLDAGVVTLDTTYNDTGSVRMNGATIYNYDGKARGVVSMQEVLNQSLNTGAAFVSKQLGHDAMREYFYGYGLDEKTGIQLPGEVENSVANLEVERDLEFATAAFGQGIALTPIATVRALSVLANGGKLIQPYIVQSIDYRVGGSTDMTPDVGRQVLKRETSEEISRMLAKVTDDALESGRRARDRHSIALKTGTAQIAAPGGGYHDDIFNHTYFGYFPAYEPEFLIFLMARHPQGVRYASQTLTDPFFKMTDFLINYYNIPPDR